MRISKLATQIEAAPQGKRKIRKTIYGNWNAYIGGKFFKTFGDDCVAEREAQEWAMS